MTEFTKTAILVVLGEAFDVLETMAGDTDMDFENDDEEIEGAPAQYAARKVMAAIQMLEEQVEKEGQ